MAYPSRFRRRDLKQPFAAHLRQEMTDAERKLWALLRGHQVADLRFRRQQPIGPYIVDFYCSTAKLVIELDGDQHGSDINAQYDEERTHWLNERGYQVLRFPNRDAFQSPQTVIDAIAHVVKERNLPPSP